MDSLSVAASIISIVQLTGEVIKYFNPTQNLLINLLYHLNEGKDRPPWYIAIRALSVENGPLDQYKQALE